MKNTKGISHSSQQLVDKLQALVAEAETAMAGSVSERSAQAIGHMRERFTDARDRLGDIYTTAKDRVVASAKTTDSAIRTNPYQSIAIAVGVGMVVGLLVGRHRKA